MERHNKKRSSRHGSAKDPKSEGRSTDAQPLITTRAEVAKLAERLATRPIIALDTEFLREKTFCPKLGLIQVADREDGWLLDPLALSKEDIGRCSTCGPIRKC